MHYKSKDLARKINEINEQNQWDTGTPSPVFFPRPRPRHFGKYRGIPARPRATLVHTIYYKIVLKPPASSVKGRNKYDDSLQ